ncbi:unnamed protein product [Mytilus coruscus]|uniref:Envelope fusion protein n=1 Tax=Mytilus coruscus TaxID=42192 RepID=A0A6J8DZT7_MYTCO|nr:unnamed protein product [Mytilus coruscus]
MHLNVYKSLANLPKLNKKTVQLQSENGNSLNVLGCIEIDFFYKKYKNVTIISYGAKYDLDVEYFVVNAERSKYVLLKQQEIQACTNTFTKFCKIISPVYPLFLKKRHDIDKYCRVVVEPNSVLPMASYISSGSWLVTTNTPLHFAIVCEKHKHKTTFTTIVNPPLNILALNETCTATNDYLTLLPFYSRQSTYTLADDPFTKVIQNSNLTMRKLWKPFHDSLPKFNLTELPKELKNIKEIPMDNLIYRLKKLQTIQEDSSFPNWVYNIIYLVISLSLGFIIFILCKYRKRLPSSAKRGSDCKIQNVALQWDKVSQLVSAKTEGDVNTSRDVPSVPMLDNSKDEEAYHIYPLLKLAEQTLRV